MKEKAQCPGPSQARGDKAVRPQAGGEKTRAPHPMRPRERGLREGTHRLQGPTPGPPPSSNTSGKEQDAAGPGLSLSEPAAFWVGGMEKDKATQAPPSSALRPWPRWQLSAPRARLPLAPDLAAPRPEQRRPRAPPAPPGKMAPAEQLRHQPWRRARPSAILAPCDRRHPPAPARARIRGAPSAKLVPSESVSSSARPRPPLGRRPAGPPALRKGWSGPGRGSPAVLRGSGGEAAGPPASTRRAPGGRGAGPGRSPPRTCPALPAAATRRSGSKEETRRKHPPGARRRLRPHPLPSPSRDAGSILPRRKKMRFTPKSFQERKETGGRGEPRGGDWKS